MDRAAPRFRDALELLAAHAVEFVVVGGVAAVLEGAPISTFDLDIVHARTPANVERLLAALGAMNATYRDPGGLQIAPTADGLLGPGHHLLMTTCGPLDVLGQIGRSSDWTALMPLSAPRNLGTAEVYVLGLKGLIAAKEESARPKDLAMLPILRRALRESPPRG